MSDVGSEPLDSDPLVLGVGVGCEPVLGDGQPLVAAFGDRDPLRHGGPSLVLPPQLVFQPALGVDLAGKGTAGDLLPLPVDHE